MKPDHVFARESLLWNEMIGQYAGKTVRIGDVWTNEITLSNKQTMYWIIKFSTVPERDATNIVQIDSFASTDKAHLLRLGTIDLSESQRTSFFKWDPERLPSERLVVRIKTNFRTMDLVKYENLVLEIYKSPEGFKKKLENKVSLFDLR